MPYLNLDVDYFEHPKTRRLVGLLGSGAEIYPQKLWVYCAKFHCETGILINYKREDIEAICGWSGEPGMLYGALLEVGFLDLYEALPEARRKRYQKRAGSATRSRFCA